MWWRLKRSEYEKQKGEKNRRSLKRLVDAGAPVGLIAYDGRRPVAWCSVAPREHFPVLERSRVLKRVDDRPVWSIVCIFVARPYRRKGATLQLLNAAVEHVRKRGGRIVEGYPVEPSTEKIPDVFAFTGLASAFKKAGFTECARRSATRPVMRFEIKR
jgi:GNAT superfamily N-acetyltransferase